MAEMDLTALLAAQELLNDAIAALQQSGGANPVPPPPVGVHLEAYVEGAATFKFYYPKENNPPWGNAPWDTRAWDRFERDAGKKVFGVMFGQPNFWTQPFNFDGAFDACVARGAVPVVDMMTFNTPLKLQARTGPGGSTRSEKKAHAIALLAAATGIASGLYDTQISDWAASAAAWGKPFKLRLDCEMNGAWYDYGAQARGNPAVFVAMWQHVHDLFVKAGASNVSWHWCPNVDPEGIQTPLEALYPGDDYVDWTGMTGYSTAANETFAWVFKGTYDRLVKMAPSKPIGIGETASAPVSRAKFLADMSAALPTMPNVKAVSWFNWRLIDGVLREWPIEATALAQAKAGFSSAYFVGR